MSKCITANGLPLKLRAGLRNENYRQDKCKKEIPTSGKTNAGMSF